MSQNCTEPTEIDYFYTHLDVYVPVIKFHLVVIENITDKPIEIKSLYSHKLKKSNIIDYENYENIIATSQLEIDDIYINLKPSEKYVIPLYTYFQHPYLNKDGFYNEKFIVGNTMNLKSLHVDGFLYDVREFNPETISIYGGFEGGSCPYAYVYSEVHSKWMLVDHILYGMDEEEKENYDTINLPEFNGTLKIKEIDPETSYIDLIKIVCNDDENPKNSISYYSNLTKLNNSDDKYIILNQGDSLLIDFPTWSNGQCENLKLISKGYYIPYKDKLSKK